MDVTCNIIIIIIIIIVDKFFKAVINFHTANYQHRL